jgi:CheY-like chemotaxis protein
VPYRRPLILVVDEDEKCADVLRSVLAYEGFGVVNVPNGNAALDRVRAMHAPPRLIFLEWAPQVTSGWAILEELARDVRFSAIPVVLLAREPEALRNPCANVVALLAKPVPVEELTELVRKHSRS